MCDNMLVSSKKLILAIGKSWSRETCYPPQKEEWTEENPALGQCAVTALVVNDFLGGNIAYNSKLNHYWNILPDNSTLDLTKIQFHGLDGQIKSEKIIDRDSLLIGERAKKAQTKKRYKILKERIIKYIQNVQNS